MQRGKMIYLVNLVDFSTNTFQWWLSFVTCFLEPFWYGTRRWSPVVQTLGIFEIFKTRMKPFYEHVCPSSHFSSLQMTSLGCL